MPKFTNSQWGSINNEIDANRALYGFPARRSNSVVLSSFNIMKFGKASKRSTKGWEFLTKYCKQCDLIAVQEIQDRLEAIQELKRLLGPKYRMVVSDITGGVPRTKGEKGSRGMRERLAYLYRHDKIEHTEVASDLTFDRTGVFDNLLTHRDDFVADIDGRIKDLKDADSKYQSELAVWNAGGQTGEKPKRDSPALVLQQFLTFIRTPHCASFRIKGSANGAGLEFLAVNAHLHWGSNKTERWLEFKALLKWLISRTRNVTNLYHKNLILFGDLNLDFTNPNTRRPVIEAQIRAYNGDRLYRKQSKINFPFIDVHNGRDDIFRTNARVGETYDHIAFFGHKKALPLHTANAKAGTLSPDGFNYGVFNYADAAAVGLEGKKFNDLPKSRRDFLATRFKSDISDHMPIWVRLPVPAT